MYLYFEIVPTKNKAVDFQQRKWSILSQKILKGPPGKVSSWDFFFSLFEFKVKQSNDNEYLIYWSIHTAYWRFDNDDKNTDVQIKECVSNLKIKTISSFEFIHHPDSFFLFRFFKISFIFNNYWQFYTIKNEFNILSIP